MGKKRIVHKGQGIGPKAKLSDRTPVDDAGEFETMLCFSDAARKINVTRQTVANYVNGGLIPFFWGINGIPHIYEADLIKAIECAQSTFSLRGQKSRFESV